MNRKLSKTGNIARVNHRDAGGETGMSYRRYAAAPRALFATPPVDLMTLVIAEAMKRKAHAELQRDVEREARYEMPVSRERHEDRHAEIRPFDSGE